MTITTLSSVKETRLPAFLRILSDHFSAHLDRRRTLAALKACSPRNLQDVGIIPEDIAELEHHLADDALNPVSRKARIRAGNW